MGQALGRVGWHRGTGAGEAADPVDHVDDEVCLVFTGRELLDYLSALPIVSSNI